MVGGPPDEEGRVGPAALPLGQPRPRVLRPGRRGDPRPPGEPPRRLRPRHPPLPRVQPGPHGTAAAPSRSGWAYLWDFELADPDRRPGGRPVRSAGLAPSPSGVLETNSGSRPMRIAFDRDACQGHNRCYLLAPESFDVDDEGYAVLLVHRRGPCRAGGQGPPGGGQLPRVRHHPRGPRSGRWASASRAARAATAAGGPRAPAPPGPPPGRTPSRPCPRSTHHPPPPRWRRGRRGGGRRWCGAPGRAPARRRGPGGCAPHGVGVHRHASCHQRHRIGGVGDLDRPPGAAHLEHPVDPQRAPGVAGNVAGHQVPAGPGAHQAVRIDQPLGVPALAVAVGKAEPVALARAGQLHQDCGADAVGVPTPQLEGGPVDGADPLHQRAGQHLLQLGQGRQGGIVDPGNAPVGRQAQPQGDGHGLVVVEQQRGQAPPRPSR